MLYPPLMPRTTRSVTRKLSGLCIQPARGILALPDELLARVLAHLPSDRDFGRADCVCSAWHAAGSPVEQALRQRIEARDGALPGRLRGVCGGCGCGCGCRCSAAVVATRAL